MTPQPAEWQDTTGKVVLGGAIDGPDGSGSFAAISADGTAFTNITPYTIDTASAAAIITGLVALGLMIDNT